MCASRSRLVLENGIFFWSGSVYCRFLLITYEKFRIKPIKPVNSSEIPIGW